MLSWVERRPGDHPDEDLPAHRLELSVGGLDSRRDSAANQNAKARGTIRLIVFPPLGARTTFHCMVPSDT